MDGRWTPTFPNAKYILAADEYAACEVDGTAIFHENVLPIMEAGQAALVDTDYALDDEVWLTPAPGHTAGHVAVNIASRGRNAVMIGDLMQARSNWRTPNGVPIMTTIRRAPSRPADASWTAIARPTFWC